MLAPWVIEEMKDVDLQDKRLNERLAMVLNMLGQRPDKSIPTALDGGHAETTAADRTGVWRNLFLALGAFLAITLLPQLLMARRAKTTDDSDGRDAS